jgi:hypothetical protein
MPTLRVNDVAPRVQYVADGAQTGFTVPFFFFDPADLQVRFDDGLEASAYSVNGAGEPGGGAVLFADPPPAGVRVTIWRDMALERGTEFQEAGAFRAGTINDELDRLAMLAQEQAARLDRVPAFAPTTAAPPVALPAPAAGKYLRWTADGEGLESVAPIGASTVAVSPFVETLLDDADAAAARATLGLPAVLQNGAHSYGAAAGTADALTLALSPAPAAYAAGQLFWFKAAADNTGPATLAVNGLPATPIQWRGAALAPGDIRAGGVVEVVHDGAAFQLTSPPPGGWRLLKSVAAANSPALDFAGLDATYELYQLVLTNVVPSVDGVDLLVRLSHGGSFTGGTGYAFHTGGGAVTGTGYVAVNGSSNSAFQLNNSLIGNGAGEGYSGRFWIAAPAEARTHLVFSQGVLMNTSGIGYLTNMGGYQNSAIAVDALRLLLLRKHREWSRSTLWVSKVSNEPL